MGIAKFEKFSSIKGGLNWSSIGLIDSTEEEKRRQKYTQQFFAQFFILFIKNQQLKQKRSCECCHFVPSSLSQWCHKQGWKVATVSDMSQVNLFILFVLSNNRTTKWSMLIKRHLHILYIFRPTFIFRQNNQIKHTDKKCLRILHVFRPIFGWVLLWKRNWSVPVCWFSNL